ncbi:hypothetical protein JCM11641_000990, partial [Rhodosporidiobolus odoratus]
MDAIRAWPTPRNPKDILRFMGTAQWMADHLPHLNEIAAPSLDLLARSIGNGLPHVLGPSSQSNPTTWLCAEETWLNLPCAREPEPAEDDDTPFADEPSAKMVLAMWGLSNSSVDTSLLVAPIQAVPLASVSTLSSTFPPSFLSNLSSSLPLDTLASEILLNPSAYPSFSVVDNRIFHLGPESTQLYVPAGRVSSEPHAATFVEAVVQDAHRAVGHMGGAKTLDYVRRAFWWPSMHRDVFDYVRSCESCARSKAASSKPFGLLHPLDTPTRPWAAAGLDFMVGLPPVRVRGEVVDSILTVTDLLSKMVVLIPLSSTATAEDVASLYHDFVVRRFGIQDSLVSDRDPKFTSRFWRTLHAKLDTTLRLSSSAHPQTDGRSEVTNKIVGQILRTICEDNPEGWASALSTAELAINSASSSATGMAPFEILYGFLPSTSPVSAWSPSLSSGDFDISSRLDDARLTWLRCTDALIESRVNMVHQANKKRRDEGSTFNVGDKVYVSTAGMRFP